MPVSLINTKGLSSKATKKIGASQRPQRDPFAPSYELLIRGGRGASPVLLNDNLKQFIDSIEYEDNAEQFDKLTMTFTSQIDKFGGGSVNSLIDSKLFSEGTIIELKLGYGNSLITVGAAEIVSIESDFPESGPPTLQLICYDLMNRMSRSRPKDGVSYKGFRDSQIASIIGSRNGFIISKNDPRSFSNIQKTSGVFDRVQKKGLSDYEFLKKVADINGFDLFCKFEPKLGKFILFFRPAGFEKQKETFLFAYNEGDLAYQNTLLSFSPKKNTFEQGTDFEIFVLKNKEVGGSKLQFVDKFRNKEQKRLVELNETRFTGGNIGPNGGKKQPNSDGIQVAFKAHGQSFRFPRHKRFKNEAEARKSIEEFIKRQKENFITAEGTLIGVEALQARQIHKFEGVSEQFSGKYFLTRVVHTLSKDEGYKTNFSARKMISDIVVQPSPKIPLTAIGKKLKNIAGL